MPVVLQGNNEIDLNPKTTQILCGITLLKFFNHTRLNGGEHKRFAFGERGAQQRVLAWQAQVPIDFVHRSKFVRVDMRNRGGFQPGAVF